MQEYIVDNAYGSVYRWSDKENAYVFYAHKSACTKKELKQMENGTYIDDQE